MGGRLPDSVLCRGGAKQKFRRLVALVAAIFGLVPIGALELKAQDPVAQEPEAGPLDLSQFQLALLYENSFDKPQQLDWEERLIEEVDKGSFRRLKMPHQEAEWIVEGWGGTRIENGRMWVSPSKYDASGKPKSVSPKERSHMVVWNKRIFPADLLLEFEVNHCGSDNGLTLLFLAATGNHGEDIFDLDLPVRRAEYPTYHSGSLQNYSVSYWSRNKEANGQLKDEHLSNRIRKNPGKQIVAMGQSLTDRSADTNYRIRILKIGGHLEVEVQGRVVVKWTDPGQPYGAGRIGLRSMEGISQVSYDNFRVWEVRQP